jgi:hypothetical protein
MVGGIQALLAPSSQTLGYLFIVIYEQARHTPHEQETLIQLQMNNLTLLHFGQMTPHVNS